MTDPRRTTGACLVFHDPQSASSLVEDLRELQSRIGAPLDCVAYIGSTSTLQVAKLQPLFQNAGLQLSCCEKVDDRFLDFSMYAVGLETLRARGCSDVVFANDTLASRHRSAYLRRMVADRIARARGRVFDFPVLIGPHSRSEYSFGDGRHDEFISTYLFYLNAAGLQVFAALLQELESVHRGLAAAAPPAPGLDAELVRLCRVHATQLEARYHDAADAGERLARKLVTVYCERALADRVRHGGLIWYVGNGLVGRLLIPLQTWLGQIFTGRRRQK